MYIAAAAMREKHVITPSSSFLIIIQMSANFPPSIYMVYFPLSTTRLKFKLHNVGNLIVLYSSLNVVVIARVLY